ncbi:MAG TPA: nucleotidyltransferase domain-containing protein [Stellaceae bacterium]|jgi:predicted nucleotidyltransferase
MAKGSGMTPTRIAEIERIRTMVLDALGPRDAAVILFGSCATGEAVRSSDIDVAILPRDADFPNGFFADLREAFEESTIPYNVDLVDLRSADPDFRRRIEKEGVWSRR